MAHDLQLFPPGFVWGTATSSYQIEGAVHEDGRGPSIWDTFSHTPGMVKHGHTGDIACDHYHRWSDDLDLIKSLGIQSYRFSIAWPRIQPTGAGAPNQRGLDFYKRLVDGLHQRGIQPMATLYHWDLPQALEDTGGWRNRATAERFAEYADLTFRALGDGIADWITHNEPWVAAFIGHYQGRHAPGLEDFPSAVKAGHHLLLSHGLALQAWRALGRPESSPGKIGITLNLTPAHPAGDAQRAPAEDAAAARRQDGYSNRWFLDPIFRSEYPADMVEHFAEHQGVNLDYVKEGDLALIGGPIDFLGINYYFPQRVVAGSDYQFLGLEERPPVGETSFRGWEVAPRAFHDLLLRVKEDYGDIPIYITENGAAFADQLPANGSPADGSVDDGDRLAYIHTHLANVHRAIADGVPVKGYYAWSLMDNFEWGEGYDERFGIVRVDFETLERTPKRSGLWYRDVIAQHGLAPLPADLAELGERYLAPAFGRD